MSNIFESSLKIPPGRRNKDLDAYLHRVYLYNQDKIDAIKLKQRGVPLWGTGLKFNPEKYFIEEVKGVLNHEKDIGISDAIKIVGRTRAFVPEEEHKRRNAINALRNNPEVYNAFRKAWGWQKKIDWSQFQPTEEPTVFTFGGYIRIDYKDSPVAIMITDLRSGKRSRIDLKPEF